MCLPRDTHVNGIVCFFGLKGVAQMFNNQVDYEGVSHQSRVTASRGTFPGGPEGLRSRR